MKVTINGLDNDQPVADFTFDIDGDGDVRVKINGSSIIYFCADDNGKFKVRRFRTGNNLKSFIHVDEDSRIKVDS